MSKVLQRPAVRVALGVAVILSLPLVAMQFTDEVVWTVWDFIAVGVLLTVIGVAIEMALKRAGNRVIAIGIAALGVFAGLFGEAGDAPGLVLLGIVLIASACALGVRSARRNKRPGGELESCDEPRSKRALLRSRWLHPACLRSCGGNR